MNEWFKNCGLSLVGLVKYTCQVILLGATLAGAILLVYDFVVSFFQSPDLIVQELTIEGNSRISENEIRAITEIRQGTNIWLVDLDELAAKLENHPWIKTCGVQRIPPQRIHISVRERVALAYSLNPQDGMLYGLDVEGVILPPLLGPFSLRKSTEEQEEEIKLLLSSPILSGIELEYQAGEKVDTPSVLAGLRFLYRLKRECPGLYREIVEAEWRDNGTFALHPRRRIGLIVLKNLEAVDLAKKIGEFWRVLKRKDVRAVYVDARFPTKGFAVRFNEGENANWRKLYKMEQSHISSAGWSDS
ncbi:FtsQ-type POTRA domain-containing protein [bacterium]|nr:FtsQ-type POTRA domain-containing protein [bacterium]